jgi:hypothetical protein
MTKYEKLDRLILNKIGGHPVRFSEIHVRDVAEECRAHSVRDGFRVCDRRLQALRKAGKIVSTGKGWIRAKEPA